MLECWYKRGLQLQVDVIAFVVKFVSQSVRVLNFRVKINKNITSWRWIASYDWLLAALINENHRWSYDITCNNQNTTSYYVKTSANFSLRCWSIVYNLVFIVHSTINNNHSCKQTHIYYLCLLSVTHGAILSLSNILISGLSKKCNHFSNCDNEFICNCLPFVQSTFFQN